MDVDVLIGIVYYYLIIYNYVWLSFLSSCIYLSMTYNAGRVVGWPNCWTAVCEGYWAIITPAYKQNEVKLTTGKLLKD